MAKTAILAVKIISDAKNAVAGFDQVEGKAGKLGKVMKVAAGAALTLGTALVGATIKGIKNAGDLEQSMGAVDAVFKGSSGQMHAWADDAAETLGLAKNEYNELATIMGTQLKNGGTAMDELGAKTHELLGVGSDLSAMFGGTTADAVSALSSALKGERDPIEKYGVSLRQSAIDAKAAEMGFQKVAGGFDNQAQQAATLALIMEQTSDANGAFARETDTLAHKQQVFAAKMENLSAKLGAIFLPIATKVFGYLGDTVVPILEDVVAWFDRNSASIAAAINWVKQHKTALIVLGAAILGVVGGVKAAIAITAAWSAVTKAWVVVTKIATIAQRALNLVLRANPIGLIITGVMLLVAGIIKLWKENETFRRIVTRVWEAIKAAALAVVDWFTGTAVPFLQKAWQAIVSGFLALRDSAVKVWDAVLGAVKTAIDFIVKLFMNFTGPGLLIKHWDTIKNTFNSGVAAVRSTVDRWVTQIVTFFTNLRDRASAIVTALRTAIVNAFTTLGSRALGIVTNIRDRAVSGFTFLRDSVVGTIRGLVDNVASFFSGLPGRIIGAISSLRSRMTQFGRDMMQGMINGIRNMATRLANAARDTVKSAVNSAKSFLGIRSPSRLWASLGYDSVRGMVNALDAGHRKAGRAGHDLAHAATDGVTIPVPGLAPGSRSAGAGGGVTVNITINGAVDPRGTADQLRRILNQDARIRGVVDLAGVVVA